MPTKTKQGSFQIAIVTHIPRYFALCALLFMKKLKLSFKIWKTIKYEKKTEQTNNQLQEDEDMPNKGTKKRHTNGNIRGNKDMESRLTERKKHSRGRKVENLTIMNKYRLQLLAVQKTKLKDTGISE